MFEEQLIVVGTGIRTVGQLTIEAIGWIKRADKVFYLISDPVAASVIQELNPEGGESLLGLYGKHLARSDAYEEMVETCLRPLRQGKVVCFAVYGHPGVFAYPTHEAVRRARSEGFKARMLPGISVEDCLFADLNIDPASSGCQSYEATDLLVNRRILDPTSHVILWQMHVLGSGATRPEGTNGAELRGLAPLLQRLYDHYAPDHLVCLYEAPLFPGVEPTVCHVPLRSLVSVHFSSLCTLYIPPGCPDRFDAEMFESLGLE